jgi:hypothetical protein
MTAPNSRPVWGADVAVSMPLPPPPGEPVVVDMYGFGMTQFRLVHNLTQREYAQLAVPVYQPRDPAAPLAQDDAAIDAPRAVPGPAFPVSTSPAGGVSPAPVPPVPAPATPPAEL